MIGVIAKETERPLVRELFELFKTPWEYYEDHRSYDVVLCSGNFSGEANGTLIVIYGSEEKDFDPLLGVKVSARTGPVELARNDILFPVYNGIAELRSGGDVALEEKESKRPVGIKIHCNQHEIVRIGYDLFSEIETLLSYEQPVQYASVPTLEIHIAILRDLMVEARISFIEIPPVPIGCDFIGCLTHDIDFAGIRAHKFDDTLFGFLYRALWRTLIDLLKGKATAQKLWRNLRAAAMLPAVYLGIVRDFWMQFEGYRKIEKDRKSTFFFLPYKGNPGCGGEEGASPKRACKYDIRDVEDHISRLESEGCEIGLHGIDAWNDGELAKGERDRVGSVARNPISGARMHWLYFNSESPKILERAGLMYDSSRGYNNAVGFCAGTAQVYRPLGCQEFYELPLLIQDTALFYSGRMGLGENEAFALCKNVIEKVSTFGGVLVINWHDRSLAPERLWGDFYVKVLDELRSRRVWFATGSEVVQWFKKRRLVRFGKVQTEQGKLKIKLEGSNTSCSPDLKLKVYFPRNKESGLGQADKAYIEVPIQGSGDIEIPLEQAQGENA